MPRAGRRRRTGEGEGEEAPVSDSPVLNILGLCRYYRVRHWMDSLWMTEVGVAGGRVDLMVVDLRTHEVIGYEVKVSRGDFLQDRKWSSYTPYFNRFYLATLPGVVVKGELPAEVGHLEMRGDGDERRLVAVQHGRPLQPRFTRRTLGEEHLLKTMLAYLRDFNWRSDRLLRVHCAKCGHWSPVRDPRGLPFGRNDNPKLAAESDRHAAAIVKEEAS